ncbi:hypothetical protein CCZ01_09350 [Helicobacter monodelphidis]|uniref:hypothetical protein n=1 Tax=Helicobacter sp. 15-1451 TaxID=2004995 RepID=UPI000DCB8BE7|nr:hypothetical protein [Helicobacter sp. 15-1451]RAX56490.1 hypothetical protein CCZ01_09350 [Helicobacter sp. 15-1451]
MNKIIFCFLMMGSFCFGCLCIPQIKMAYEKVENHIKNYVGGQSENIEQKLIPEIEKSIQDLQQQNLILRQSVMIESQNILKQKEILFEMHKKNQMLY